MLEARDGTIWVRTRHYASEDGLDRHALTLVEDLSGRLFLGTLNGIVQFDPERRAVRHYTTSDGLPSSNVITAVRDGRGDLWFGTQRGLARLRPSELSNTPPGPARISGVQIGDRRALVSDFGDIEVTAELQCRSQFRRAELQFRRSCQRRLFQARASNVSATITDNAPTG